MPSDLGGADGLRFRHILLRDAAYDAIPKAERASLHEAFAEHLQASLAERTTEFDEFIGYHLEQAHRMRDELGLHDEHTERLARSAFEHLRAAGLRAAERGDAPTAATLLRHAVDLRDADDPDRLEIAWVLGFALADSGSIPEARELLSDAIVRADAANNERAAAYARCAMATVQMFGEFGGQRRGPEDRGRARPRAVRGRWGRARSGPGMVHDRVRAVVRGTRRGVTHVGRARRWFMLEPPATA